MPTGVWDRLLYSLTLLRPSALVFLDFSHLGRQHQSLFDAWRPHLRFACISTPHPLSPVVFLAQTMSRRHLVRPRCAPKFSTDLLLGLSLAFDVCRLLLRTPPFPCREITFASRPIHPHLQLEK
ncbi:hypothetical protein BC827DRAFT_1177665 [Russula dissimulans]|nr:hypothetical protein BC827DRAFT_1177665 [Russula dissimulans]